MVVLSVNDPWTGITPVRFNWPANTSPPPPPPGLPPFPLLPTVGLGVELQAASVNTPTTRVANTPRNRVIDPSFQAGRAPSQAIESMPAAAAKQCSFLTRDRPPSALVRR